MERLLIVLWVTTFSVTISSIQSATLEFPTDVIVTVQTKGDKTTEVELHLFNKISSALPDDSGLIKVRTKAHGPTYYSLRSGGNSVQVFLMPGDSLHMDIDWSDPSGTTKFSGNRVVENEFLINKRKIEDQSGWTDWVGLFFSEPEELNTKLQEGLQSMDSLISSLESSDVVDKHFVFMEKRYPEYRVALVAANYVDNHSRIKQIHPDEINFSEEEAVQKVLNLDNSDYSLLPLPRFQEVIQFQRQHVWREGLNQEVFKEGYDAVMEVREKILKEKFQSEEIIEFLQFDFIKTLIRHNGPGDVDPYYESFLATTAMPHFSEALQIEMKAWQQILPGMLVPDFEFEDREGEIFRLSDLRGKIIYIDVWATWCGPCLMEMPYWYELVEEYKGQDIYFLAISLDAMRESWEKMLDERDMKGIHVFTPGVWEAEFARYFNVRGIPRFILIDADRKVIIPQAERPSGKIRERLDKILESF